MKNKKSKGISPVAVGVTGAIVGAGAVIAGAVALNKKNNRKKVEEVLENAKDKAVEIKKQAEDTIDNLEKKFGKGKKIIKKSVKTTRAELKDVVKE